MSAVPCLILAGGLGTRIRSVLGDVPKCLAPVGDQAFLSLLIAHLRRQGFTNIALSLGHGAEQVERYIAERPALQDVRACREPSPLGTGGAILYAMHTLGLEETVVVNGDTFLDAPAESLWSPLRSDQGERIRMLGVEVADTARFGALHLNADGRLAGFQEKGVTGAGRINAGYYRVGRPAFGDRAPGEIFSFETEILTPAAAAGAVQVTPVAGRFTDIGVPDDYQAFCRQHTSA